MFDSFEPFRALQKKDFSFKPNRYENWIGGKMIGSGQTSSIITAKAVMIDGKQRMEISFTDAQLNQELARTNVFDEFQTSSDRLRLLTVPATTNVDLPALQMLKMVIGATRAHKNFSRNEPYCCNLFLKGGELVKMSFSYSNPEKLLEFYS